MKHYYSKVQGWASFIGLYKEVIDSLPYGLIVEIGTWKGKSAAFAGVEIINSGKPIRFVTVDHFQGSPNHRDCEDVKTLEQQARANLKPVASVVDVLALPSVEAAATFEDGSIDFLFIDGTHDYENVKADLLAWKPKVKAGGLIAGDDANWDGVKEAAREILGEIVIVEPSPKGRYWRAA
ncbi:MAG TPA: class I SAM-dependent methyltransferase [Sphingopyxis sp.]|nr:class I SAM-dependent methyltransferase [Sphingopyxis sp.]